MVSLIIGFGSCNRLSLQAAPKTEITLFLPVLPPCGLRGYVLLFVVYFYFISSASDCVFCHKSVFAIKLLKLFPYGYGYY